MALSGIEMCSSALVKLGAAGIDSFDDGSAEARVASRLYPLVRDALLSVHPWSFATVGRVPESDFPPYFTTALVARLAAEFCLPLTENSSRAERLSRLAETELKLAKLVDSQQVEN